jgi:hypothetical protein
MFRGKLLLAIAAVVAAMFAPTDASARHRRGHYWAVPVADYCGGRWPAYGADACGFPEFSYGDGCWKRVIINTSEGLRPRRVRSCGPNMLRS